MSLRRIYIGLFAGWLGLSLMSSMTLAWQDSQDDEQEPTRPAIRRAERPRFVDRETESVYFLNAFVDALKGDRPTVMSATTQVVTNDPGNDPGGSGTETAATFAWSALIPADVMEAEIKRLNGVVEGVVTTPGRFEAGGHRTARIHFSMLASLFAIINEHDDPDIKWKSQAAIARTLFAQVAANAKAGSSDVYQQARRRKDDLREIINGGNISAQGDIDQANNWENLVDRAQLMYRLEIGYEDRLKPWTSNENDFNSNQDELLVEASVVAAIGEVLAREGMPDAIEDGYVVYANEMRDAAVNVVQAINTDNYQLAAESVSAIDQACQNCHFDWQ